MSGLRIEMAKKSLIQLIQKLNDEEQYQYLIMNQNLYFHIKKYPNLKSLIITQK